MTTATLDKADRARAIARTDPVSWCRRVLKYEPWSKQTEIIESVFANQRTAVMSCHGSGKTATAARVALTFLAAYPRSRVITTAPTFTQVRDLLWSEIHTAAASAPLGLYPSPDQTRMVIENDWYMVGVSTDRPERFQGHHAENILLIVDEASGVDERIYEAAEGFMTAEGARILLIGNPTRTNGQFYRAFHSERSLWNTIHISAFDTPNFTGEVVPSHVARNMVSTTWVEDKRRLWGEDSPMWQVRVLGEFPRIADDQIIGLASVEQAQAREAAEGEPVVVSCDVARYGSDETVIVVRRGEHVRIAAAYTGKSLMETAGRIIDTVRNVQGSCRVVVDDAGLGGGVTDRLREVGMKVEAFNGGATAHDPDLYPNRRSEAWFAFAAHLPTVSLDPDAQLAADLVSPRYALDSRGRRVVESKDTTKKRLGRSPDRADAILMAYAPQPRMGASFGIEIWD
jgi:phage terminase large subunit